MKKLVIWLNVLLIVTLCIANYFYLSPVRGVSKAFCSGIFAALGGVNALYVLIRGGKRLFAVVMALGLLLAMGGDLRIGPSFVQGAALFAAGHICFWLGYQLLTKPRYQDLLWTLLVLIPSAAYLVFSHRLVFSPGWMRWICLGYAVIISLMTGKALSGFCYQPGWLTGILALGSVLFFFSDLMLLLNMFGGFGRLYGILCMSTYYPAQLLLAHSIFHAARQ